MGPEDIIITGSASFKQQAFNDLQKLTTTPLVMLDNGKVVQANSVTPYETKATFIPQTSEASQGNAENIPGTNLPVNKPKGTDVVNDAINSSKTVTLKETTGGNQTTTTNDALVKSDGSAGKGANATIEFNPNKTTGGVNVNGNSNRPAQVGLGHELIHADHDVNGKNTSATSSGKLDPDGRGQTLSKEELNTRKEENQIRQEQQTPERKLPQ
ncbi:MAG: M91 family zinc metallopeptidase [Ginsengibacter sp.]